MSDQTSPHPSPSPSHVSGLGWWACVVGFVVIGSIVSGCTWWHVSAQNLPYQMGQAMGYGIWIILLYYAIAGRGRGWRLNTVAAAAILMGLCAGSAISAWRTKRMLADSERAQQQMLGDIDRMQQSLVNSNATGAPVERLGDDTPKAGQSDVEVVAATVRSAMNETVKPS